jgi:hypothetical protein
VSCSRRSPIIAGARTDGEPRPHPSLYFPYAAALHREWIAYAPLVQKTGVNLLEAPRHG